MRRVIIGTLCAVSVAFCVSVVNGFRSNVTTETHSGERFAMQERFEPAAFYKKNCAECHGSDAEKKFEPALPEAQLIDAILNGEKLETPPDMPAFAEKGINEARAKVLLIYMKSLRE